MTSEKLKVYTIAFGDAPAFSIEVLDERPTGFSSCVPELAIYSFGQTERQAIDRLLMHVLSKYEDLLTSPAPLNANEQEFLKLYRAKIIPAMVEQNLKRPPQVGWRQRLRNVFAGSDSWRDAFLENLKTSLKPSSV